MYRFFLLSSLCVAILLMSGCGGGNSPEAAIRDANSTNLARMTNLFVRHIQEHAGKGPKDEAAFKAYINDQADRTLERMGIERSSIDDMFVSERDSQPFNVIYDFKGATRGTDVAVVLEAEGVKGKRMVGFTSMANREIADAAEYDKLLAGAAAAPTEKPEGASSLPPGAAR